MSSPQVSQPYGREGRHILQYVEDYRDAGNVVRAANQLDGTLSHTNSEIKQ